MEILITETQEVKTLKIETDPTDSLIANYSGNDEFKNINDDVDGYVGNAEYEMSQEDFSWWEEAINNYNQAEALEAYYKEKYGDVVVDAVLKEYFFPSEIGDYGADKILALEGYFENNGCEYHELSELKFLETEDYLVKHDNENGYDFSVSVAVSDVLTPVGTRLNESEWEVNDVTLILHGCFNQDDFDFDVNDAMSGVHINFNHDEKTMSLSDMFMYVYDIACNSKTTNGLNLEDSIEELIKKELKQNNLLNA